MAEAMRRYERQRDGLSLPLLAVSDRIASYRWTMVEVRGHLLELSDTIRDEVAVLTRLDETDRSDPGSWVERDREAVGAAPA